MPLADQLIGKSATERAQLKAVAHYDSLSSLVAAAAKKRKRFSFVLKDGRTVEIEQVGLGRLDTKKGTITRRDDGGADPLWVRLNVDGKYPNGDGWYGFVNPPVLAPDGPEQLRTFREDIAAATLTIIAQALGGEV